MVITEWFSLRRRTFCKSYPTRDLLLQLVSQWHCNKSCKAMVPFNMSVLFYTVSCVLWDFCVGGGRMQQT